MARFRFALPRLPQEGPQRTALSAIAAGGLLVLLIALLARGCAETFTAQSAMERYVKLGPRQGAAELERDLLRAYPPGSGVGPLFAQLARMGFDCGMAVDPAAGGECRFRAQAEGRRVTTAIVAVAHDGAQVRSIAARMTAAVP